MKIQQESSAKWLFYSGASVLFLLLQLLFLDQLCLFQTYPFLYPLLVSTLALREGYFRGGLYGIFMGLLADLLLCSGPTAWFYTIALTLSALAAALISKYWISPGALCALAAGGAAFLCTDLLRLLILLPPGNAPVLAILWISLKELLLSLPFVLAIDPVFSRIHYRFRMD